MSISSVDSLDSVEADLLRAVRGLRFGAVEVTVHEGRIVQIETREKVRFDAAGRRSPESRRREKETSAGADRSDGGTGRNVRGETDS